MGTWTARTNGPRSAAFTEAATAHLTSDSRLAADSRHGSREPGSVLSEAGPTRVALATPHATMGGSSWALITSKSSEAQWGQDIGFMATISWVAATSAVGDELATR